MKDIVLKVEGMMCTGCENRIINSISNIDKVKEVIADHNTGIVTIKAKDGVDVELIKQRISDLDFKVVD